MARLLKGSRTISEGVTQTELDAVANAAGQIRQVKWRDMGAVATGSDDVYLPNTFQFDNAILASSDVWMSASGAGALRIADTSVNIDMWFSSADGGSLGEGTSGQKFLQDFDAYVGVAHTHTSFSGQFLVTDPGSTTPTFRIYMRRDGPAGAADHYEIHFVHMTIMEIRG